MKPRTILLSLAVFPFALLFVSTSYVHARMEDVQKEYTKQTERDWEELKTLDAQFLSMQRVRTLLKDGKEKTYIRSYAYSFLAEHRDSPWEDQALLQNYLREVREGIEILEARLASIGRKAIHINVRTQEATAIEKGNIVARYRISSGARATPTPRGAFQIHEKQKLRVSSLDVPYRMPFYMAFTPNGSHGLHALPYLGKDPKSSDYWQEARSHIGIPVSHGCVRFLPEDAEALFEWAEIGTKVYISA